MVLGMSLSAYTTLHVIISLIGILSGIVAVLATLGGTLLRRTTDLFLLTTVLTSVTGFLFPFKAFGPPHAVGVLSLLLLAAALPAYYRFHLAGRWRTTYVITAVACLYFNAFVGVVQAFQKIAFFNALAPTQKEPPFVIAQGITLIVFIVIGVLVYKRFRVNPGAVAGIARAA